MSESDGPPAYWRSAAEDEAMQDEHAFVWEAMIKSVGTTLGGSRVLDIGCNRGGFLRMLSDRHGIAEGFGYDPAGGGHCRRAPSCGRSPAAFRDSRSSSAWLGPLRGGVQPRGPIPGQ